MPFALLGAGVLCVALAAWRPVPAGVWHDDGVYMLVGRALAEGHGLHYQGVVSAPPAVKFPPIYPLFLAGLWTIFGEIGAVTLAATLANLVFVALAAVLFARSLHVAGGVPLPVALAAGGLGVVSSDVLRTTSVPLSEPLFLTLVAAAFALWAGAAGPAGAGGQGEGEPADPLRLPGAVALSVVLAVIMGTRAAGLPILMGFAVALAARRGFRATLAIIGPPAVLWMAWNFWSAARGRLVPADLRDLLGPYGGWMREQVTDPVLFLARTPAHVFGVLERVAVLLLPRVGGAPLWLAFAPLLGLMAVGWVRALRRHPPLAWCSLLYLGLLLAWPYLDRRLVVPLHTLAVALVMIGGWTLSGVERPLVRRGAVALTVLWIIGYSAVGALRIAEGWPAAGYRIRAERLAAAVEALGHIVPEGGVVGAPEFWAALHLHGGWTVAPSVLFDPGASDEDTPTWGTPEAQERLWRGAGIEYLLLEQGGALHGAGLDRLEASCPGTVQLVAMLRPQAIVRLDWDAVCRSAEASPPRSRTPELPDG